MGLERASGNGTEPPLEVQIEELREKVQKQDGDWSERYGEVLGEIGRVRDDMRECMASINDATGKIAEYTARTGRIESLVESIAKGMNVSIPPQVDRGSQLELEKKVEKKVRTPLEWGKLIGAAVLALTAAATLMQQVSQWFGNH